MSKTVIIKITRGADEVIAKARETARRKGLEMTGDNRSGNFQGMGLQGRYVFGEGELTVTVEKKPFLLGWGMIENTLREFFAEA